MLADTNKSLDVLPTGALTLTKMEQTSITKDTTIVNLTAYTIFAADLNPSYIMADNHMRLFAVVSPSFIILRDGFEAKEKELRTYAEKYSAERFESLQKEFPHNYGKKVRIANVKIFDPRLYRFQNCHQS